MPLLDLQEKLGIDIDKGLTLQSIKQPQRHASLCYTFEKEWLECADGIGKIRAETECKLEMEDLMECVTRHKMVQPKLRITVRSQMQRLAAVTEQRKKLIKEGKYTLPDYHGGKLDNDP